MRQFYGLLVVGFLLGTCLVHAQSASEPGVFIESVDAEKTLIRCTGEGETLEAATLSARQQCVEWFIRKYHLHRLSAPEALAGARARLFERLNDLIDPVSPASEDGKGQGVKSRVRLDENRIRVALVTTIHRDRLDRALEVLGLAASTKPPSLTVAVVAKAGNPKPKLLARIADSLTPYFNREGFQQVDTKTGADLLVVLTLQRNSEKGPPTGPPAFSVTATVTAHDLLTGAVLGTTSARGVPRAKGKGEYTKAVLEACHDAMFQLMPQLASQRAKLAANGFPVQVRFENCPDPLREKLRPILGKLGAGLTVKKWFAREIVFALRTRLEPGAMAQRIETALKEQAPEVSLTVRPDRWSVQIQFVESKAQ